jgi:hypothetical protein
MSDANPLQQASPGGRAQRSHADPDTFFWAAPVLFAVLIFLALFFTLGAVWFGLATEWRSDLLKDLSMPIFIVVMAVLVLTLRWAIRTIWRRDERSRFQEIRRSLRRKNRKRPRKALKKGYSRTNPGHKPPGGRRVRRSIFQGAPTTAGHRRIMGMGL